MNLLITHGLRFIFFLLVQVLILNQLEIGLGIQFMIYPLFILLLPVELKTITLMLIAFVFGLFIDAFSNTYGLHTSALLIFAYMRPLIFRLFAPRDGYDILLETTVLNLGYIWYLKTFGILLLLHHFWFFMFEMFKLNELVFVLQKTILSVPLSVLLCLFLQYLFIKKSDKT